MRDVIRILIAKHAIVTSLYDVTV